MNRFKNIAKKFLSEKVLQTYIFYKNFSLENGKNKIYRFFDNKTIQTLNDYPEFKVGEVIFLDKKLKFSHAGALIHSVEELFCEEIYSFNTDRKQPYIIDCGSNIGLSIIFFKKLYPDSIIVAFEPDKSIFKLLEQNIESYQLGNVTLFNLAVWNKTEEISFFSEGALAGSLTTDYSKTNIKTIVKAVDLLEYLDRPIDLLKIDIEGAEYIVLKHIQTKLFYVKNLFIEYHSDKNNVQELGDLLSVISTAGFRYYLKEAATLVSRPFLDKNQGPYDLQMNIFCYR